jgi:uncharacterized membrane protein
MKNVVVASFKEESKAIEALDKLNEQESFGNITIYDLIMVRKKSDGDIEILKQDDSEGWRTIAGMGIGSLLGLLGGPVGLVIGLYTGTAIGAIADAGYYDLADEFMRKIKEKIAVGTTTIIAEIDEQSEVFLDNYLKPMGGVITRGDVDQEFDMIMNEEIDEIESEIAEETAALKKSAAIQKSKIQGKIAGLLEKRRAKIAEFVSKAKHAQESIKSTAKRSAEIVKAEVETVGSNIDDELKKNRLVRLKRRINRHENILNNLNSQLKNLQS